MKERNNEIEVDLGKLLHYYLRHWLALVASGLGMALLAFLVTFFLITPKYQAGVTIYVNSALSSQQIQEVNGSSLSTAQKLVQTYANILQSNSVLEAVINKGGLHNTAEEVRRMMTVEQVEETEMFTVTVDHPDAKTAAKVANAIAEIAPDRIASIVKGSSTSIIDYATIPDKPHSPSYPRNIILGGLLGGVIMGGVLTFRYLFDMRITGENELVQSFGAPVLGSIPTFNKEERRKSGKGGQAE